MLKYYLSIPVGGYIQSTTLGDKGMLQLIVEPIPEGLPALMRGAFPTAPVDAFAISTPAHRTTITDADAAEELFRALTREFLKPVRRRDAATPRTPLAQSRLSDDSALVASWHAQTYRKDSSAYAPIDQSPALDYGRLFDYLGKLRTTQQMYGPQYGTDELDLNKRYHNDGQSLSDRDIDREMIRDRNENLGLGFMDRGDPVLRERYELHKRLMGETMKFVRQILATC